MDAHAHVPHITHWTNLPRIRRLCLWVFLECSTLYPLIYCRPSPPHQNTVCLSLSHLWCVCVCVCVCVCGLRLGCPDPPQLRLYKPCVPKAAHWAHHPGPPSLKRCRLAGLTSPSLQESLFVSQLASCCILAIWHRPRRFNSLKQAAFVNGEQCNTRKWFTLWLLLFFVYNKETFFFCNSLEHAATRDHHPLTARRDNKVIIWRTPCSKERRPSRSRTKVFFPH